MKHENFMKAMDILSKNHSTQLYINKPHDNYVGELGSEKFTIRIKDCCGAVISNLMNAGFSLSMEDGLTSVSDYRL
tara:strand:+ start:210 stop:437 length:228 start_codon:yes stop_codon:yes gene_type:complete